MLSRAEPLLVPHIVSQKKNVKKDSGKWPSRVKILNGKGRFGRLELLTESVISTFLRVIIIMLAPIRRMVSDVIIL